MSKILDLVTIKIKLKLEGNSLAIITLNWQDEFEVRFFRLSLRDDNTLWFQPPALKEFSYAKCFGVINVDEWKKLEEKVITQFKEELKAKAEEGAVPPKILERINKSEEKLILVEEDYENIDKVSNK